MNEFIIDSGWKGRNTYQVTLNNYIYIHIEQVEENFC